MPRRVGRDASLDLEQLVVLALPVLRQARCSCPRTGRGPKPKYQDEQIAIMILCGVLKKKKSKSAQFRFVQQNSDLFKRLLQLDTLPARSRFFARHRQVWPLVQKAIELQGRRMLCEHIADARVVAADKSLVAARGPQWNQKDRKRNCIPKGLRGIDREADWGCSAYNGWVYGFSYEVVVSATEGSVVIPLLASVDVASAKEQTTFAVKIDHLPASVQSLLIDPGYDSNDQADQFERSPRRRSSRRRSRRSSGRRWVCPPQKGFVSQIPERGRREGQRRRRLRRYSFLRSRRGRKLYGQRKQTVEPFNGTFKAMFELDDHAWHRGLDNNRSQQLTAIFGYQLLIRYHWRLGGRDAQVKYLLDGL